MTPKDHIKRAIIRLFFIFPIKKKSVLFNNFYGKGFDDNPRAIAEQINSKKRLKLYWVLSKENANAILPEGIIRLKKRTLKYYYAIATSHIWVSNVRLPEYYIKRRGQFYIQTWHGSGIPYKMVEYDALNNLSEDYKRMMSHDDTMIDLFLSGSRSFTDIICRRAFKYSGEVLECGDPKSDALVRANRETIKNALKNQLGITEDNIVTYMPTFRVDYSNNPYDINLDLIKAALEKKTGKTWKILCKMHPNVEVKNSKINCSDYLSIDSVNDTQTAIIASDLLITDYSSIMFDAVFAKRPVLLYVKDYDQYIKNERGFYIALEDLPFPSFHNTKAIVDYINKNGVESREAYGAFIKKHKLIVSGTASRQVARLIEEKCK